MTSYETHLALAQERHDATILAQNDDLPEAIAYTRYEVDCPECGDPFDVEADPAGQVVECPEGHQMRVLETR